MSGLPKGNPLKRKKFGATKKCCFGSCKSDTRCKSYLDYNYYFISFPKPCLQFRKGNIPDDALKMHIKNCAECSKSDMWVRLCARRDEYFSSIKNVNKDTYICSLHFVGESGPSEKFPNPVKYKSQQENFKLLIGGKKRKSLAEMYTNNKKRILDGEDLVADVESKDVIHKIEQKDYQTHFAKDATEKIRVDGIKKLKISALPTQFVDTLPKKLITANSMQNRSILKTSNSTNQGVASAMLQLSNPRTFPREKCIITTVEDTEEEIPLFDPVSEDLPLFDPESEEILYEADPEEIPLFDPHDYAMAPENIEEEYLDSDSLVVKEVPEENEDIEIYEEILSSSEPQNTNQETEDSQIEARLEHCERILDKAEKPRAELRKQLRSLKGKLKHLEEIRDESKVLSRLKTIFNDDQMLILVKGENTRVNWSDETMEKALKLRLTCGEAGYTELLRQNIPLPSSKCLQNAIKISRFTQSFSKQVVHYLQTEFGSAQQGGKVDIVSALKKKKPGKRSCFDRLFDT